MAQRNFQIEGQAQESAPANYPLNKETAQILLDMTTHPGWAIFLQCLSFEAGIYVEAALATDYGPNALEKFRFNQALAVNIPRLPRAVIEAANDVLDGGNNLDSLYDALHLTE